MPDPLTAARLKAATLLTEVARSLGSSAVCPVRSVRFRPDGKGGELAAPFPMTAHLDAGALAQAVSADAFFERAAPSGAWIALELSEEWRDAVRHWAPPEGKLAAATPPVPAFSARIDADLWWLDALAERCDPFTAARLDRGNPAWRVRRGIELAGQNRGRNAHDRRLVNEAALLYALLAGDSAPKAAQQLIALADRYLSSPAEDALVHRALAAGWQTVGCCDRKDSNYESF